MSLDPNEPVIPPDATIMRPRPGRRPAGAAGTAGADTARAGDAPRSSGGAAPQPVRVTETSGRSQRDGPGASFVAFLTGGINPLVQAAAPLLILAGRLREQIGSPNADNLHTQCVQEIRAFEERARRSAVPDEDVLAARYALCSVIDEAVLNTPWGADSGWAARSLLVTFHRESSGGEKVFQIIDRVLNDPRRYLALIELLYICLSLGFEGRYRVEDRGAARLADVRHDLFRCVQTLRGSTEADLSPQWRGIEDKRRAVMRIVPLWVVAAACGALLLGTFILLSAKLSNRSDPINAELARVGLEPLYAAAPAVPPPQAFGLRELLAQQIARGLVSVDDAADGRTVITVTASDLFASGSEVVNPQYVGLIQDIGSAAEKVPGHYMVTGHTDDQPVRSFRFPDNFALSRERAVQVVNLLKTRIHDAGRIDFVGAGASEPRYTPANLPENRARNRRVEIIHRRG